MENVLLREATAQDVPDMIALAASLPDWFTADDLETVQEVIGPPAVVAVDSHGRVIGMCPWEERADEWEICWIAVAPELHRRGIGKRMLGWMVERAIAAGVSRIRVQTVAHTSDCAPYVATRAFYEAAGFVLERIEPQGWPDGLDRAVYILTIRGADEGQPWPGSRGASSRG